MVSALGLLGLLAVVMPLVYMYAAGVAQTRVLPTLRNKRICLLIAHPDDEAMFFAPTVLALTRPSTGNHVKILCLSTGNADGLGETRKRELVKSGMLLGLGHADDVFVVDNPDFPDSMTTTWDHGAISNLLCSAFAPQLARQHQNGSSPAASANIDILITFDAGGVSSHPNHVSLYHGARAFIRALLPAKYPDTAFPVALYTLTSVGLLRKYSGFLDLLATMAAWALDTRRLDHHPARLVFVNQLVGEGAALTTAWAAMTQAHRSQMVWFRYFWITLSRYMVINDLRLEDVKS